MKKIFTLLSLALVAFALQAQVSYSIHIDDPSRVAKFTFNGQEQTFDADGYVKFDLANEEYGTCYISTVDPYVLSSDSYSTEYGDEVYKNNLYTYNKNSFEFYPSGYSYNGVYKVEYEFITVDETVLRNNVATIKVHGNPEKLQMSNYYSWTTKSDFVEGDNIYRFMDAEANVGFSSKDYSHPLYKLEQNGTEVEGSYGNWDITLANNDVIDIYTEYPDKDVTITFEFKGEACRKSIRYLTIGGKAYTDFSEPIVAKMGENYSLSLSSINYETTFFSINGEPQELGYWMGDDGILTEDIAYVIEQTKRPCYTATVTVDDYTHIKYNEAGVEGLVPTSNTFEVEVGVENAQYNPVYFLPLDYNFNIVECTVNGQPATYYEYYGYYEVELKEEAQEINITTEALERPYTFSFYFNSPQKASYDYYDQFGLSGWWLSCEARRSDINENMKAGYNIFDIGDVDGQFQMYFYGAEDDITKYAHVYINDKKVEAKLVYEDPAFFTPADKDAVKVYISEEEPAFYTATFAVEDAAAVKGAYVDLIKEISVADKAEFEALQETGFSLLLADGYVVKLNGEQIEPMEEPVLARSEEGTVYYFDRVKYLNVEIVKGESGITTIAADDNAVDPAVYNILGVKVSNGSTDNLPAGLYIQKGQKFYVK